MVEVGRDSWRVEQKGIDWVGETERHSRPASLFWPWTAANFSFFTVAYGVFVVGLGLNPWQGALAVAIGLAVSYPVVGLVALAGTKGGAPTMTLSRAAFGHHGNNLPTFFVYLSLVGWETVSVTLGALATRTILERLSPGLGATPMLAIGFVITAGLVMVIAIYGYDVILRVQKWITLAVAVAVVGYFVIIIPDLDFSGGTGAGSLALVIGGVLLVVANGIGWTPGGADYSRYTKGSPKSVVWWTAIGGATAPAVLMLFGVLLTAGSPDLAAAAAVDPIGAFAVALPTWFLVPFLLATILSVIAGAVFNLYSSGLNLLALGLNIPRWVAVAIDGVLMVVGGIYLIFVAPSFFAPVQSFLIVIGVVTAAWSAIFVTDMFLHRKNGYLKDALYDPAGRYGGFNAAGVASIVVAIVVGLGLVTSADENIRTVLGYLLTPAAEAGSVGASNIGVAVAFVIGAVLYGVLSTTVLRPADRSG
ncbi:cytosine permease [Kibdelosporangium persicum]|uniref:Permease for cytosine/purines uracil thiamine allantoin n=1 Tax=Kibdelosporangium persicum TaxID=2698649 RepID=A0ABX2EY38_9PSEU|nr:cytosine permease [Kibdelosporangium persicum]NRN63676.1 Permease for cytosine/purines uracil thiamine allantoin [Kibdelosporangium persicum]